MLSLAEAQAVENIADLLYGYLSGSGNRKTAFPLDATHAGVGVFWTGESKRPGIVELLKLTLDCRQHQFTALITVIVHQSMTWRRGKGNPLTRNEIDQLNAALQGVSFKIPDMFGPVFLKGIGEPAKAASASSKLILSEGLSQTFFTRLIVVSKLSPQERGLQFEGFLTDVFGCSALCRRTGNLSR